MADKVQRSEYGPIKMKDMGDGSFAKVVAASIVQSKMQYTLLSAATATGGWVGPLAGGDYVWRCEGSNFGSAIATLQFLGLDGVTPYNVKDSSNADVTLSATGQKSIGVAQGSFLRVSLSTTPTAAINSALGGL